jgi:hypothetical protein
MNDGAIGRTYLQIAAAKSTLSFSEAFFRGVLCNVLVCMAVWMALAGRSVTDKFFAIVLPISAFVAAGFEHSIANMYFLPLAMMLQASAGETVEFGMLWSPSCPIPSSSSPPPARPSAACWATSPTSPAGNSAPLPSVPPWSAPACPATPSTRC